MHSIYVYTYVLIVCVGLCAGDGDSIYLMSWYILICDCYALGVAYVIGWIAMMHDNCLCVYIYLCNYDMIGILTLLLEYAFTA